jgi:hypothetical protein
MGYKTREDTLEGARSYYNHTLQRINSVYDTFETFCGSLDPKTVFMSEWGVKIYLKNVSPEEIETTLLARLKTEYPEATFSRLALSATEVAWSGEVNGNAISIHSEYTDGKLAPGCKIIEIEKHSEMVRKESSKYAIFCDDEEVEK